MSYPSTTVEAAQVAELSECGEYAVAGVDNGTVWMQVNGSWIEVRAGVSDVLTSAELGGSGLVDIMWTGLTDRLAGAEECDACGLPLNRSEGAREICCCRDEADQ